MIKYTTWTPDTCGCKITYKWDSDQKEADRVHEAHEFIPCPSHIQHSDKDEHFAEILKENQGKNQAIEEACQTVPRLLPEHFSFSFDENRKLVLKVEGLTDTELIYVQNRVAIKLNQSEIDHEVVKK